MYVVRLRRGVSGVWSDQDLLLEQPEEREESRVRGFEGSGKNARPRRMGTRDYIDALKGSALKSLRHISGLRTGVPFSRKLSVSLFVFNGCFHSPLQTPNKHAQTGGEET